MSAGPRTRTIAVLLAGFSFALHLALAVQLDRVGSLDQYDVFFHADTKARLDCVVHGVCDSRASISHPALDLLVNPPVRALAAVATTFGGWAGDASDARHAVALWVSPLAAGLATAFAFVMFVSLGLPRAQALIATALCAVSLSSLVFGSIPESFALSGAAIAAGFALAARSKPGDALSPLPWIALATIATSVTVTNLATIAILFTASRWIASEPPPRIAGQVGSLLAASGLICIVLATVSTALYDSRPLNVEQGTRYIAKWTEGNRPGERALWFATAASNSLVARHPRLAGNYQANKSDARYKFRFTFEGSDRVFSSARPLGTFVFILALIGSVTLARGSRPQRAVLGAALAILVLNATLHAFWGVGHFLYSQHWQLAFGLLVAAPLFAPARLQRAAQVVLLATVLAIIVQNGNVGRLMLAHFSVSSPSDAP